MQLALRYGKPRTDQLDLTRRFFFLNAGKCPQIGQADPHAFMLHCQLRRRPVHFAMGGNDFLSRAIEQGDPVSNETAFAQRHIEHLLRQGRFAATAAAMAHDDNLIDFKKLYRKFERRRDAVEARSCFKWWHQCRNIAHDECLARISIEYLGRIDAAIATGDDHHLGALPLFQFRPAVTLHRPLMGAKSMVTLQKISKMSHEIAISSILGVARAVFLPYLIEMNEITKIASPQPDANAPAERLRKPDWIRVKAPMGAAFEETRRLMRDHKLNTVCEEAACPNIGECWTKKHATVMILGDVCTRACAFCNVKTGMPMAVDQEEPQQLADAAAKLGLQHIVVTSVDRDDLPDGGAKQFVKVIEALRRTTPNTTIEILTPDFRNKADAAVEMIVAARPDVYNHNLETVPRLYPTIRPGARYYASLRLLESVKRLDPSIFTKSGIMLGLSEQRLEVHQVMDDMRSADIDFMTMGQYLQPTTKHVKVSEFVTPKTFDAYAAVGRAKGFLLVASSPLTRSSYHAGDDFAKMRRAREEKLARAG